MVAVVDTSDLKLTALALPSTDSDDAWLASELAKRPVTSPPPYTLPPEEIERDKLLIRRSAAARGQAQYHERETDFAAEEDDDDVNGFFTTNAGKRAAAKRKVSLPYPFPACSSSRRDRPYTDTDPTMYGSLQKKRRRGASPPIGPNLNAEYDPRVPNDYLAYKQQVYDRRAAEVEFQRWQEQRDGNISRDHDEDQWVEEQDDEEQEDQEMRALNRFPLPRPSADTRPSAEASAKEAEVEKDAVVSSMSMPEIVAPGGSAKAMTGEEAYARRVAMSAMSGEEAYQRRVGLSQQAAAQPTRSAVQPPGPPPGPPPGVPPTLAAAQLRARQTAAAAIAARLGKVVAPPSDAQVNASGSTTAGAGVGDGDPSRFAERLMHKYGHVSGQGLGAEGNRGITTPLTIQPATHTKGCARIVNPDHTEAQRARDTALYGSSTASPIIALLNMATHSDLESNSARHDLIHDIRSECNKFGIIHHIFPHTTPSSQPKRDKEVRVFVQFTGPAASWKAVRALEGRWFQGRQVQAFYYDQEAFERGDFNRPLIRTPLPSGPPM